MFFESLSLCRWVFLCFFVDKNGLFEFIRIFFLFFLFFFCFFCNFLFVCFFARLWTVPCPRPIPRSLVSDFLLQISFVKTSGKNEQPKNKKKKKKISNLFLRSFGGRETSSGARTGAHCLWKLLLSRCSGAEEKISIRICDFFVVPRETVRLRRRNHVVERNNGVSTLFDFVCREMIICEMITCFFFFFYFICKMVLLCFCCLFFSICKERFCCEFVSVKKWLWYQCLSCLMFSFHLFDSSAFCFLRFLFRFLFISSFISSFISLFPFLIHFPFSFPFFAGGERELCHQQVQWGSSGKALLRR